MPNINLDIEICTNKCETIRPTLISLQILSNGPTVLVEMR